MSQIMLPAGIYFFICLFDLLQASSSVDDVDLDPLLCGSMVPLPPPGRAMRRGKLWASRASGGEGRGGKSGRGVPLS